MTKAVSLELVSDLSTEAFLAAFTSRRGLCSEIYNDHGTNFVGGSNQLDKKIQQAIAVATKRAKDDITWKFIPVTTLHLGGEAAV